MLRPRKRDIDIPNFHRNIIRNVCQRVVSADLPSGPSHCRTQNSSQPGTEWEVLNGGDSSEVNETAHGDARQAKPPEAGGREVTTLDDFATPLWLFSRHASTSLLVLPLPRTAPVALLKLPARFATKEEGEAVG